MWNDVAWKLVAREPAPTVGARSLRVKNRDLISLCIPQSGEVSSPVGFCRNGHLEVLRSTPKSETIVVAENEGAVFLDRPAKRPSKFVLTIDWPGPCEEPPRIQNIIPQELKKRSPKVVRAGFDGKTGNATSRSAEFSSEVIRCQLKLLHGVLRKRDVSKVSRNIRILNRGTFDLNLKA